MSEYDILDMKAPRASGNTLRFLVWLLENRLTGRVLAHKLLTDAGITALRNVPTHQALPVGPAYLPRTEVPDPVEPGPPLDLSALLAAPPTRTTDFSFETAADFAAAYREGHTTPSEVAERVLAWTTATDTAKPALRVFIAQDADDLRRQAEASSQRWKEGRPLGPLDGIPVAVKDELDMQPYGTTVGTSFLGKTPAAEDCTAVARLRRAGALLVGKANMAEIGLGVTGINPHHGACRNPYDPTRATGGSSSGPAAAVAAGLCPIAIGADGGGSIRIPASLCGVVGLKGTWGRVSEHGAAPLCWSVAHIGPLAATVADTALAYACIAGPDPRDPNSLGQPHPSLDGLLNADLRGIRVGVFADWFEHADDDVVARCREAVEHLRTAGAQIVDISIPELGLTQTVHLVTIVTEMAGAHMLHYAQNRRRYGYDTRANLALGRTLTGWDYVHAQRHRQRLTAHFARVFQEVDLIATPSTATTAPVIPDTALKTGLSDLELTAKIMRYAQPGNLMGIPGLTVPAGYDKSGLPIGFQLMAAPWSEHLALRAGAVVEAAVSRRRPYVWRGLLT